MKRCVKCRAYKHLVEFYKSAKARDGLSVWCGECHRKHARASYVANRSKYIERALASTKANPAAHNRSWWNSYYARTYGISLAEYEAMSKAQGDRCAICEHPPKGNRLAVDHDHATGVVRGLLCASCNMSLGRLDGPGVLQRAIEYLEAARALQAV